MSLRDNIKGRRKRHVVKLDAPAWGGDVYARRLTAAELLEWEAWLEGRAGSDAEKGIATMVQLVVTCACDADGKPAFAAEDAGWLRQEDNEVLRAAFDQVAELNRMRPTDREAIRKNSQGAGGSPTASPSPSANGTLTSCLPD